MSLRDLVEYGGLCAVVLTTMYVIAVSRGYFR